MSKKCYGCGREVPEYWSIPFCTRWIPVAGKDELQPQKLPIDGDRIPATCGVCCDRELTSEDLKYMGVTWGGLRN